MNQRINYYNILAMLLSAGLALVIPFDLVLLSYAIMGPAHYLTEISWLNGKQFFTFKKYDYLTILVLIPLCLLLGQNLAHLIYYAFGLSFILLAIKTSVNRLAAFVLLVIAGYFLLSNNLLRTIFGLYLPSLIHLYVFTGAFILSGALKDKLPSGYIALLVFILCPVLLCVLFTNYHPAPSVWAMGNYHYFSTLNTTTLRSQAINIYTNKASIILTRVIAFAYTYHYINWFSKTRIIKWHRISIKRAIIIGLLWAASVVLYFYNYNLGIKWLFMLSLVHVILEFPLNQRSFKRIAIALKSQFSHIMVK